MDSTQPNSSSFIKRIWRLIRPYWTSEERWIARFLLFVIVALGLGEVYLNVLFNDWNNDFYNALQEVNKDAFIHAIIRFSWLAAFFIVVMVYKAYFNQMLTIKWRRWMTADYLAKWLSHQNYYRMQLAGSNMDNPDQRISEDIDQCIQLSLGLSLGSLNSVVTLVSFLAILWQLSGPVDFTVHGWNVHIPGYMVWVAFAYAFLGTWITFRIGRPLIALNYNQQRLEANFRFSLVRLRENTESIAFYRGETQEQVGFLRRFNGIVENWWQIMRRQKKLNWFSSGYGQIANIFPYVVAAPRYFAQEIKLGGLMQTGSAFLHVQGALSYLVDSYNSIANLKAVEQRLTGFNSSIKNAEEMQKTITGFTRENTTDNKLEAQELAIHLPDGTPLLEHIDLSLKLGDSLLISGKSGSGKSTLLRTLAGLWPYAQGKLTLPAYDRMLFIPQKPYLPLGTLREVLCYPGATLHDDAALTELLSLCLLEHLTGRLDEENSWSHILSLGEQQRVAFARVLLIRPDFILLDEATSALDEAGETHLYGLLKEKLPGAAVISVGHRSSLRAWHAQEKKL